MKGAIVHGVLLAVMLVYGYRTWTRDKSIEPTVGTVVVWNRSVDDVKSVVLTTARKNVKLERRGTGADQYWWGVETRTDKRVKPKPSLGAVLPDAGVAATAPKGPVDAGVAPPTGGLDAGSGSGSGSGSAAPIVPGQQSAPDEFDIITTTSEFPIGTTGEDLVKSVASMRALRDLGAISEDAKKEYGLELGDTSFAVVFKDSTRTFIIGNKVSGGAERYVMDPDANKAYVLSGTFIEPLEQGAGSLKPSDPKGFDPALLATVDIKAGAKSRKAGRITTTSAKGDQTKTWGDAATKKPDQTMANFIDNVDKLRPSRFEPTLKPADMKTIVSLTYKDERGKTLSDLTLYKRERPGEMPTDGSADPTAPPPPTIEYYVVTEKTRVPGFVGKAAAERIEQDVTTLLP